MDRFDLEQSIMHCWTISDDLDLLIENVLEEDFDADRIANVLVGLRQLHDMRMRKAFDIFEALIETGDIS